MFDDEDPFVLDEKITSNPIKRENSIELTSIKSVKNDKEITPKIKTVLDEYSNTPKLISNLRACKIIFLYYN